MRSIWVGEARYAVEAAVCRERGIFIGSKHDSTYHAGRHRSMRGIAIGRKNYIFVGSERGGNSSATI